jgi:hypothetical protein
MRFALVRSVWALRLQIRNGPVANRLTVGRGAWQEALTLTPDQVVAVDVPVAPAEQAAAVTFDAGSGFRPVDVDADSRDTRFLGVWVAIR